MLEPFCRKDPLFFFVSLAFPWFGLLCHISPLRVFSGHSTLVFTLRTDDEAYTSTPNPHLLWADKSMWTASQLVILWWFSFFLGGGLLPSEITKFPTDPTCGSVFYCVETSSSWLPPQDGSLSLNPLSLFLSLSFFLPHFVVIGLPWVSGVLCQCSEFVSWKQLHMQIIFWCICWGESGLPILFLCHLGTAYFLLFLFKYWIIWTAYIF